MAISVGTLQVNLTASTAAFTTSLDQAGQSARKSGADIQKAFDQAATSSGAAGEKIGFSMLEAKGSMMLLGEEVGVRIPRHLQSLIATIPGVGSAFATMLPLIGVTAAIYLLIKLTDAHEKLAAAIRKAALENENLTIKEGDKVKSMELTNLKLDDQIAKLEGRPGKNKLAEALLESSIAADNLATTFADSFQNIDEQIESSTTFLGSFKELVVQSVTHVGGNLMEGMPEIQDALKNVQMAKDAVDNARLKGSDAKGQDAQLAAIQSEQKAYANLRINTEAAMDTVKKFTPGNIDLIHQLKQGIIQESMAMKEASLQADNLNKSIKIAGLEQKQDIQGPKDRSAEGAINGQKLIQDALATSLEKRNEMENAANMITINEAQGAAKAIGKVNADLETQKISLIKKETADAEAALRTQYNNELTAQYGRLAILKTEGPLKIDEINKINAELAASAIKLEGDLESNQKKGLEAQATAEKENAAVILEIAKKLEEDKRHISEEFTKFNSEMLKLNEASAKEQADYSYKMGLTSLAQHLEILKADAAQELSDEKAKNQAVFDASSKLELDTVKLQDANKIAFTKYQQQMVVIAQDSNNSMLDGVKNFFNQYLNDGRTAAQQTQQVMTQAMTRITDNLTSMITTGKSNWSSYVNTIETDLEKMAMNQMLKSLFSMGANALANTGNGTGFLASIGSSMGGMAKGGPVAAGSLYTVGESGKEWFVPQVSGTIVPNSGSVSQKSSGSSTVVNQNFNITTPNKDSFMASQDQILGTSQAAAFRANRRNN